MVNIQPSVTGKQWLLVSLDGKPLAERRGDTDLTEYINSEDGINADEDIRDQQKSFLSKLSKAAFRTTISTAIPLSPTRSLCAWM